jgi:hypothetical protein
MHHDADWHHSYGAWHLPLAGCTSFSGSTERECPTQLCSSAADSVHGIATRSSVGHSAIVAQGEEPAHSKHALPQRPVQTDFSRVMRARGQVSTTRTAAAVARGQPLSLPHWCTVVKRIEGAPVLVDGPDQSCHTGVAAKAQASHQCADDDEIVGRKQRPPAQLAAGAVGL